MFIFILLPTHFYSRNTNKYMSFQADSEGWSREISKKNRDILLSIWDSTRQVQIYLNVCNDKVYSQ